MDSESYNVYIYHGQLIIQSILIEIHTNIKWYVTAKKNQQLQNALIWKGLMTLTLINFFFNEWFLTVHIITFKLMYHLDQYDDFEILAYWLTYLWNCP